MLREMVQINKPDLQHVNMHSSRISKDKELVKKVMNVINDLVNPFKDSSELPNIVNATVL